MGKEQKRIKFLFILAAIITSAFVVHYFGRTNDPTGAAITVDETDSFDRADESLQSYEQDIAAPPLDYDQNRVAPHDDETIQIRTAPVPPFLEGKDRGMFYVPQDLRASSDSVSSGGSSHVVPEVVNPPPITTVFSVKENSGGCSALPAIMQSAIGGCHDEA